MVNVHGTRAILLLSPEGDDADVQVVKTLLAITNDRERRAAPYHVVAELTDPRNASVAKMIAKDEVEVILTAPSLEEPGFVTDFGALAPFKEFLDTELDHHNLHEILPFEPLHRQVRRA